MISSVKARICEHSLHISLNPVAGVVSRTDCLWASPGDLVTVYYNTSLSLISKYLSLSFSSRVLSPNLSTVSPNTRRNNPFPHHSPLPSPFPLRQPPIALPPASLLQLLLHLPQRESHQSPIQVIDRLHFEPCALFDDVPACRGKTLVVAHHACLGEGGGDGGGGAGGVERAAGRERYGEVVVVGVIGGGGGGGGVDGAGDL